MKKRVIRLWVVFWMFTTIAVAPALAAEYQIDPEHSSVSFKVSHLLTKVRGTFDQYSGVFSFDPQNPKNNTAKVTIQATSINTKVEKRDKHLRSEDFFNVEKFPVLTFTGTKYVSEKSAKGKQGTQDAPQNAKLHGTLTLHGVSKPIVLDVIFNGHSQDPWGNKSVSFEAVGKINRKDFGLTWNKKLDKGGWLVGDEVELEILVEANPVKSQEAQAQTN